MERIVTAAARLIKASIREQRYDMGSYPSNELFKLGFSVSYDEVTRYKQSVIQSENQNNLLTEYLPGNFIQRGGADNIDHNIVTLDGQGTFHGTGIIAISTPNTETSPATKLQVVRRQHYVKVNQLVKDKGVPITSYFNSLKSLALISFKPVVHLKFPYTLPSDIYLDLLWHSGWMFSSAESVRPNWSDFMLHISCNDHNSPPPPQI